MDLTLDPEKYFPLSNVMQVNTNLNVRIYNKQSQSLQTHFFYLGCRHSFNILENQHVKKGYMEFYFKRVLLDICTHVIYITMLPRKRGIHNENVYQ